MILGKFVEPQSRVAFMSLRVVLLPFSNIPGRIRLEVVLQQFQRLSVAGSDWEVSLVPIIGLIRSL